MRLENKISNHLPKFCGIILKVRSHPEPQMRKPLTHLSSSGVSGLSCSAPSINAVVSIFSPHSPSGSIRYKTSSEYLSNGFEIGRWAFTPRQRQKYINSNRELRRGSRPHRNFCPSMLGRIEYQDRIVILFCTKIRVLANRETRREKVAYSVHKNRTAVSLTPVSPSLSKQNIKGLRMGILYMLENLACKFRVLSKYLHVATVYGTR
jgi:hypothetical protein